MDQIQLCTRRLTRPTAILSLVCLALGWLSFAGAAALAGENPGAYQKELPKNEKQLIEMLHSAAPPDKAVACKQLAIYGGKDAVPELAKLLADEQLASWSRIALEAIPDSSADEALRKATETLKGKLLVGVINSIGVRRDAGAVTVLASHLKDQDTDVASAAAVALGQIADPASIRALQEVFASAPAAVRNGVAEGLILCAERMVTLGKLSEATELFDAVRISHVPKQRKVEATRGAILARKSGGIPLLVEQLKSPDVKLQQIGLSTARELPGREVTEALAGALSQLKPEQAALLLYALLDRNESFVPRPVMDAAKNGPTPVRIAAITVIGSAGDPASVSTLLEIVGAGDADLAAAAKAALAGMPGDKVNGEIIASLAKADGKTLPVLIEIVGMRRIDATEALIKALDQKDETIRAAALTALGETVGPKQLGVLIAQVVSPRSDADAKVAERALRTAAVRMPDREATASELAAALPKASARGQAAILSIVAAVGGTKALETVAAAVAVANDELQEIGSKALGEWMTADAAPALLSLAKTAPGDKYKTRALRAYIRIARQFKMPEGERLEMCDKAMAAATRPDEQKLVLAVWARYASLDSLARAVEAAKIPGIEEDAKTAAMQIAQKLGDVSGVRDLLAKVGLEPMKVEIVKAQYGAGEAQKDVTLALQPLVGIMPVINLPRSTYNMSFGGDPAPEKPKELKISYRINGKPGEALFAENSVIMLPMPK